MLHVWLPWLFLLGKILLFFGIVFGAVAPVMIWVERKVCALIQDRVGPNRVGPFGLLQSLADGIKLVLKEPLEPEGVVKPYYYLAPVLAVIPAALSFAIIPFGPPTTLGGLFETPQRLQISNLNVGILFLLAVSSLSVYGVALAGWSSNNKYSVMGALRASAQMISYELAAGLAVVTIVLLSGTVDLVGMVEAQAGMWHIVPGFFAFLVFLPAIFAETNRLPFDLPESEAELVVGYHTEYSGIKFGLFFLAEYAIMTSISSVCVLMFFGGWELWPGFSWNDLYTSLGLGWNTDGTVNILGTLIPIMWFVTKVCAFLFLFVWVRWTLPRFRYDQLMLIGWKRLLPLAILNITITAAVMALV